jgi:sulfur carrier protein ThiS
MNSYARRTNETSERVNRTIADIAERLERESAGFVTYINDEVVPRVRQHSTKALRTVSEELSKIADYLDNPKRA